MRKSKYLGMKSDSWVCTHVGIERVQPQFCSRKRLFGKRVRSSRPGHCSYYYIFERPTSDGKANKMIRLNAQQALLVLKGAKTVEEYAEKKTQKRSAVFTEKVSYSFCD